MAGTQVREAIEKVSKGLAAQPDKARTVNSPATATLQHGLRCSVQGPAGEAIDTDMPRGVGGEASAPNPGWYMRAALASCNATCIAMEAAVHGIELARLEVSVASVSDTRGMLGLADVPAGLQELRVDVRIDAPGVPPGQLEELVQRACARSPVGCTDASTAQVHVTVG